MCSSFSTYLRHYNYLLNNGKQILSFCIKLHSLDQTILCFCTVFRVLTFKILEDFELALISELTLLNIEVSSDVASLTSLPLCSLIVNRKLCKAFSTPGEIIFS